MMMPLLVGLAGCSIGAEPALVLDEGAREAVVASFMAAQPEARLALVWDLDLFLPEGSICPERLAREGGLERWSGGCVSDEGVRAEGVLERFESDDVAWVAGDHFQLTGMDGEVLFYLDGAVEVTALGDLLLVEAALSTCGGPSEDCWHDDFDAGLTTMDLAYTIYPVSDYPQHYQVTISGLVAAPDEGPATIHGAWTLDTQACVGEPVSGSAVIGIDQYHFLEFDGQDACDNCAFQTLDGQAVAPTCAVWLP